MRWWIRARQGSVTYLHGMQMAGSKARGLGSDGRASVRGGCLLWSRVGAGWPVRVYAVSPVVQQQTAMAMTRAMAVVVVMAAGGERAVVDSGVGGGLKLAIPEVVVDSTSLVGKVVLHPHPHPNPHPSFTSTHSLINCGLAVAS